MSRYAHPLLIPAVVESCNKLTAASRNEDNLGNTISAGMDAVIFLTWLAALDRILETVPYTEHNSVAAVLCECRQEIAQSNLTEPERNDLIVAIHIILRKLE